MSPLPELFPLGNGEGPPAHATGKLPRRAFLSETGKVVGAALAAEAALARRSPTAAAAPPSRLPDRVTDASAVTMARLIRERRMSPLELMRAQIAETKRVDAKIHAVEFLVEERALKEAELAERAIAHGQVDWQRQPLFGVPFSAKDNIETEGVPTTAGAPNLKNYVPARDATTVERLRRAGAILLAKSRVAFEACSFEAANLFGRANNPYSLDRGPGGSSGGEAALIAAGGSPFGLGNDAGASIRVPAHYCGVAGLVPAYGRVSMAGFFPPGDNLGPVLYATIGPMARFVEDLATALPILAGVDYRDPFLFPWSLHDWRTMRPGELRIAWWTGDEKFTPTPETIATVEAAAKAMKTLGAKVTHTRPPYELRRAKDIVLSIHGPGFVSDQFEKELQKYGAEKDPAMARVLQVHRDWVKKTPAKEIETLAAELPTLRRTVLASMQGYDAVLTPVTLTPAMLHEATWDHVVDDFVFPEIMGTVWSLPAGAVRCGTSPEKLPIGVQVVGSPGREDIVLAVMGALERELGGWKRPAV